MYAWESEELSNLLEIIGERDRCDPKSFLGREVIYVSLRNCLEIVVDVLLPWSTTRLALNQRCARVDIVCGFRFTASEAIKGIENEPSDTGSSENLLGPLDVRDDLAITC